MFDLILSRILILLHSLPHALQLLDVAVRSTSRRAELGQNCRPCLVLLIFSRSVGLFKFDDAGAIAELEKLQKETALHLREITASLSTASRGLKQLSDHCARDQRDEMIHFGQRGVKDANLAIFWAH